MLRADLSIVLTFSIFLNRLSNWFEQRNAAVMWYNERSGSIVCGRLSQRATLATLLSLPSGLPRRERQRAAT
jgi:hypothetical protein